MKTETSGELPGDEELDKYLRGLDILGEVKACHAPELLAEVTKMVDHLLDASGFSTKRLRPRARMFGNGVARMTLYLHLLRWRNQPTEQVQAQAAAHKQYWDDVRRSREPYVT